MKLFDDFKQCFYNIPLSIKVFTCDYVETNYYYASAPVLVITDHIDHREYDYEKYNQTIWRFNEFPTFSNNYFYGNSNTSFNYLMF